MSESRMAGDKLNEPTKESQDAAEALSRSERNKQIRDEIAADPERTAARIGGVDREAYDFDGFSDSDIVKAMQGSEFGEKDYARLTGQQPGGTDTPEPEIDNVNPVEEVKESPIAPPIDNGSDPVFGMPEIPYPGGGYGGMNVQQDNDQISNVTGDNNTVTQDQDNSVQNFGGREFNPTDWKNSWMNSKFAA